MPTGFGPIAGLRIGHAQSDAGALASQKALGAGTGCTVLLFDPESAPKGAASGMVAACEVRGGAVGERELETLRPTHLAPGIHALVFAGGSAFGLEAATGVMRWCEEHGMGFDTGAARKGVKERIRVPIVPAAILFDLRLALPKRRPDAAMGYAAAEAAARAQGGARVAEGNVGAGAGASVGKLFGIERAMKAGIGCWTEEFSTRGRGGRSATVRVAALAAVNAFGDIRDPDSGKILAGARAAGQPRSARSARRRGAPAPKFVDTAAAMRRGAIRSSFADPNTVLVAVATNAALTRQEGHRVAVMASAGMARVISPAHTTFDGDIVFALSVGAVRADVNAVGAAAAEAVARAIVRGVTQARSAGGLPGLAAR